MCEIVCNVIFLTKTSGSRQVAPRNFGDGKALLHDTQREPGAMDAHAQLMAPPAPTTPTPLAGAFEVPPIKVVHIRTPQTPRHSRPTPFNPLK